MSFELLLDELENLHDKNGNRIGRPFPFRKARQPVRIARVTRSESVAFKSFLPQRSRRDYGAEMDNMISGMNKAMSNTRATTIRLSKPSSTDLRKAMENFDAKFQKAMTLGELTPDEICRLEAHRNRMMQGTLTGLI